SPTILFLAPAEPFSDDDHGVAARPPALPEHLTDLPTRPKHPRPPTCIPGPYLRQSWVSGLGKRFVGHPDNDGLATACKSRTTTATTRMHTTRLTTTRNTAAPRADAAWPPARVSA
ncbi:hypothetical protein H0H81_002749, partial [Sphagnurus paluster]